MNRIGCASVISLFILNASCTGQEVAKVQATIQVPAKVASFNNYRLVLTLHYNFPQFTDKGPVTVETFIDKKFSHEMGTETKVVVTLGEKAKFNPKVQYYLTLYTFDANNQRSHLGERDGENSQNYVLTNGAPSRVLLILRPVEKK